MKLDIITTENAKAGQAALPKQFDEPVRDDLIKRAVLSLQAAGRQAYGGYGNAGMRHSTRVSRRRKDYRGSYGKGISRVPRKVHTHRGSQFVWVGALAAGTVGGRRAHQPKPYKDWNQKVNRTENRKAIRSALAATVQHAMVEKRGHKLPKGFPFLIDTAFEAVAKTKDLETALVKLGFAAELERADSKSIRAGRGKSRGRKHKTPTSFLFVVSKDESKLANSAKNLPGAEVVSVHRLNAELLAPGAHPGRLTLYTQAAVERLAKEALYTKDYSGATAKKEKPVKKAPEKKAPEKKAPVKKTTKKVAA